MTTPFYGMIEEVRVMLVDNDKEFITQMVDLLKSYDYTVMMVGTASAAMSVLSKGKQKVDVMIFNVHSSNMLSFNVVAQAVALDIVSLVVCDEHNEPIAKKALDEGAYLYVKKPFDKEIVKYLWQFVLREKMQREKERQESRRNRDQMNVDDIGNNNIVGENEEQFRKKKNVSNNIHEVEKDIILNGEYKLRGKRGRKSMKGINGGESQNSATDKVVSQKDCIEWTDDLHDKFMKAVQLLGEGRCYPKEILEEMKVPGLTRMQIASHLQKCRRNNWRSPKERKTLRHRSGQGSSSGLHEPRSSFRRFGTMPSLPTNVTNLQHNPRQTQRGPEFSFPILDTSNLFARGDTPIQPQLYCPQLQVQPHYFSMCNPFNNPFWSAQNNVGGGIQQHEPLFGTMNPQGLPGATVGNTNDRLGLDYSLDLNVTQGKTYSGSRIMFGTDIRNETVNDSNLNVNVGNMITYSSSATLSDTYARNVTINGLGAANSNFQQYIGEPNMSNPSNIVAVSYESDTEGRNSENCDAYFNSNSMDYPFQNLEPPSASLPNEQGGEFDQVYSDDQVAVTPSVQFQGVANYSDESSI